MRRQYTPISGRQMRRLKRSSEAQLRSSAGELANPWISAHVGWAFLFGLLLGCLYISEQGAYIWVASLMLLGIVIFPDERLKMRLVDWCPLVIAAYEVPSVLLSEYRAHSIRTSWVVILGVLVYYAVRLTIRTPTQIACLSAVLGVEGTWLAMHGFREFVTNSESLHDAGFSQLLVFRSRLIRPPSPWIPGEWFTLLFLCLPFACAFGMYCWNKRYAARLALIFPVGITAALFLSLSRAVFWSTIIFYLTLWVLIICIKVVRLRAGLLLLVFIVAALSSIIGSESVLYPGLARTYTEEHVSQTRSAEGRLSIWKRSVELVRAHPLWGVGSGNAALSLLSTADADETTGFVSRSFSLPVQVLSEKGVFGFILYGGSFFLCLAEFIGEVRMASLVARARDRSSFVSGAGRVMRCCFAAGLLAVMVREITYSSILEHGLTFSLVMCLVALLIAPEREAVECG